MSDERKTNVVRFDSIEALVRDNERWAADTADGDSSRRHGNSRWAGTDTYEQAVDLLQIGWPEGAKRVANIRASLDRAVDSMAAARAATVAYGYEGEWVDIGRLSEGDPECCGYWDENGEDSQRRVIKIVANICVSASVSTEAMYARGAACIAAVDLLESLGHRVELWAGIGCDGYGNRGTLDSQVLIKDAGQPAEPDRLAYVLCHPAFFRRIYFAHMEVNGMNPGGCCPCGVTADGAVVLPEACTASGLSHNQIVKQVADICALAGVAFDPAEVMEASRR